MMYNWLYWLYRL